MLHPENPVSGYRTSEVLRRQLQRRHHHVRRLPRLRMVRIVRQR